MIKEAIAYITNLAVQAEKPEVLEINGRTYCTKNMTRYDKADMAVSGRLRRSTTSRNTWRMLSTVLRTANKSPSSHNMIPT